MASTISIPTNIKIIQTKKIASNATSNAATNVQPHVQIKTIDQVKTITFPSSIKTVW